MGWSVELCQLVYYEVDPDTFQMILLNYSVTDTSKMSYQKQLDQVSLKNANES